MNYKDQNLFLVGNKEKIMLNQSNYKTSLLMSLCMIFGIIVMTIPCYSDEIVSMPTGVLHGTITDSENKAPVANVKVEAGNFITYSESNGYYRFSYIPEGTYNVAVIHPHYKTLTIQRLQINPNQTVKQNFPIRKNYQPVVQTGSASRITCKTVTLNGAIFANGMNTTAYFEYGPSQAYGMKTPFINAGNSAASVSINVMIDKLTPETEYHFRLVAKNADGVTYGNENVFSTSVPLIEISPFQTIGLPAKGTVVKPFTIRNQGCAQLQFQLSVSHAYPVSTASSHDVYADIVIPDITNGIIEADGILSVAMTYTSREAPYGDYQVDLTVSHNALNYPNPLVLKIPIQITAPKISISPNAFEFVVEKGNIQKDVLTIANNGNTDLVWQMDIRGKLNRSNYPEYYYIPLFKHESDTRVGEPLATHYGGPDQFGYMWSDSLADAGPSYDWIDISRSGKKVDSMDDDDHVGPLNIGFSFPFYGIAYDHFYVTSNGLIGFGPTAEYASHTNMPIPSEKAPNNFIAALWDDLSPKDGNIYYYSQGEKLIVQFDRMKEYRSGATTSFQVILEKDGTILFQYKSFGNLFNTNSCTVGIENANGSDGLQVAFNINYLTEKLAIRFEPDRCSWLKIYQSPAGRIAPDSQVDISIGADTTYLDQDQYICNLVVLSDDIIQPQINIPVRLKVKDSSPIIAVQPSQINFELNEDAQDHKKISIINQGTRPLVWTMTASCLPDKTTGYSWTDSDKPGGPIFDWIDIEKSGKKIRDLKDDGFVGPFSIGFDFPFYGGTYAQFYVSSNGLIAFESTSGLDDRINKEIPESRTPDNFLAWFWDDLTPRDATIVYKTIDNQLIVSFINYGQFGNSGASVTAQVIIHSDGTIVYQYHHFRDGFKTDTATIGIENKQGDDGVQAIFNASLVHDSYAIRFQSNPCQWLSANPVSGTIAPQVTESIAVHATSKDVSQGKYDAVLSINSNDKSHSPIHIPVHLIVKGQSHPPVIESTVIAPKSGDQIYATIYPIQGTASATEQETIARVEVSLDAGQTWKVANGTNQWRYVWTVPTEPGNYSICARAVGHSGDYQESWETISVAVISREASRVLIDGRTLSVNESIFQLKGVSYSPIPIGHDPEVQAPYGDYFTSEYQDIHKRDLPFLRLMGANTVRLWTWCPTADHTQFLDEVFNDNLDPMYVVAGFWIDSQMNIDPDDPANTRSIIKQSFLDMVRIHMNHPSILMWCIGNELNAGWMYGKHLDDIFSLINEMATEAKILEGRTYHPVTTTLMDINFVNTIRTYDSKMTGLSAWSANVFRGESFGDLFSAYSDVSQKPLVILEFGIDALDNKTQREYEMDGLSKQSEYARALWREIDQSKSICVGASIMAYSDEWWKGKKATDPLCEEDDPAKHGFCGYASNGHPDGYANEEWWGIMRVIKNENGIDKVQPRNVYHELQKAWNNNPIPPEENKIIPLDCKRSDNFGRSVAIYGSYAAGGAKGDDNNGENSGAVYMMHFNGRNWVKEMKIEPEDGKLNDYFGCAVAIFKEYAIFGSYGNDEKGSKAGAAYIYRLTKSGWVEHQKLFARDIVANDYFAYAVDINDTFAIIGAYGDDDRGSMSGSAYIFGRQANNQWEEQQKLVDSKGDRNDQFGYAVGISEEHAIVGAYRDDEKGDSAGSAIIYNRNQDTWYEQTRLNAFDGDANDYFGYAVSISGDYAVVGAYRCDDNRSNVGCVYVYKHEKGTWNHQAKIIPEDGASNDYFGFSLELKGTRLIVGAYGDDDKGSSSGSAYLYSLEQDQWVMQKKYVATDGESYDYFGYDVGISDEGIIMGAYGNDAKGTMAGAVYIYGQSAEKDLQDSINLFADQSTKERFYDYDQLTFIQFDPKASFMEANEQNHLLNQNQGEPQILSNGTSEIHIEITNVPPVGNRIQNLAGKVTPFDPLNYAIKIAIFVDGNWRIKPGKNRENGMLVNADGSFSCDITTEMRDHLATKIAVLVVKSDIDDMKNIEQLPVVGRLVIKRR